MPKHLQFNPHIRTGYRPLTNFVGCIASLFYIHNETINILTHGLALVYMLNKVPNQLPWYHENLLMNFLSWCHLFGAISPWIGSFIYHLFMNMKNDEKFYTRLLKLDMLGIWICQSVGAIPMIASSVHCSSDFVWYICIFLYIILSLWGLIKAMRANSAWNRRLCFLPGFIMRMIIITLRFLQLSGGAPESIIHIILQDLVAVVGGAIGAMRIPEKWIPGKFDIVWNSHNIMHVMVVMAAWSMHLAAIQDMAWMMEPTVCQSQLSQAINLHEDL